MAHPSSQRSAGVAVSIPCITRIMTIQEIISLLPQSSEIMAAYGLHCFSCSVGGVESLQDGCRIHGFDDDTIDALVEDLNDAVRSQPLRPQELHLTDAAAEKIGEIAEAEGHAGEVLRVLFDDTGSFCMEFTSPIGVEDPFFKSPSNNAVAITASPLTLWRIGGATIDFRDGQFKLDLPEDAAAGCACKNGGSCACKTA